MFTTTFFQGYAGTDMVADAICRALESWTKQHPNLLGSYRPSEALAA